MLGYGDWLNEEWESQKHSSVGAGEKPYIDMANSKFTLDACKEAIADGFWDSKNHLIPDAGLEKRLKGLLKGFNSEVFYRKIFLKDISEFSKNKLGNSWAYNKKTAMMFPYLGDKSETLQRNTVLILTAKIDESNINKMYSAYLAGRFDEDEVRVYDDKQVQLQKVELVKVNPEWRMGSFYVGMEAQLPLHLDDTYILEDITSKVI